MSVFLAFGGNTYVKSVIKAKCEVCQTGERTLGYTAIDWGRDFSQEKLEDGVVMFVTGLKMD